MIYVLFPQANEEMHTAQVECERRMTDIWKQFAEWLVDYDVLSRYILTGCDKVKCIHLLNCMHYIFIANCTSFEDRV